VGIGSEQMPNDEEYEEEEQIPQPEYTHTLRGTGGTFTVTSRGGEKSVPIHFVNTHLNMNDDVFSVLETFRESFDEEKLNFEQILQRDINDYRVSTEMIPYVLGSNDHIKGYEFYTSNPVLFYPPIVCLLVPYNAREGHQMPSKHYNDPYIRPDHKPHPKLENWTEGLLGNKGNPKYCVTIGKPSEENFTLWKPKQDDSRYNSSTLQFHFERVKLIMVDGQHRGMSLLALHRNLKEKWDTEKKQRYKPFYSEWSKDRLSDFDLSELNLPMIVCVAPTATEANDVDITEISRKIFLTLNKTAKVVSTSRTLLMNDMDLPAEFMRTFLKKISLSTNADISTILREEKDTSREVNPLQFTSVETGIYPVIEDLVLASRDKYRTTAERRKGKGLSIRTKLDHLQSLINNHTIDPKTSRRSYSKSTLEDLTKEFVPLYIEPMVTITEDFSLIKAITVKKSHPEISNLTVDKGPMAKHNIWSGTRRGDIVRDYGRALKRKQEKLLAGGTYLQESRNQLEKIEAAEIFFKKAIKKVQVSNLLSQINKYEGINTNLSTSIFDLLTENMFVGAVYLTFFDIVEICEEKNSIAQDLGPIAQGFNRLENRKIAVQSYVEGLNKLFQPADVETLNRLTTAFCANQISKNSGFDDGKVISKENQPFKTKKVQSWIGLTWGKKEFDAFPNYSVLLNILWKKHLSDTISVGNLDPETEKVYESLSEALEVWLSTGIRQAQSQQYLRIKKDLEKKANDDHESWEWPIEKQEEVAETAIVKINDALTAFCPNNEFTTGLVAEEIKTQGQLVRKMSEPSSKNVALESDQDNEPELTEQDDDDDSPSKDTEQKDDLPDSDLKVDVNPDPEKEEDSESPAEEKTE
jgi:hypothetical protein